MKKSRVIVLSLVLMVCGPRKAVPGETVVKEWQVFEVEMTTQSELSNPYVDGLPDGDKGLVQVIFTGASGKAEGMNYTITGFWDGGEIWKARFAPPASGVWAYTSISKDPELNGVKGEFTCTQWTDAEKEENQVRRGFIRVCKAGKRPGRYFEYSDGTPFLWIGDTWWNWTKRGISFSSFKKLADDRAEKGFTIGQLFVAGNVRKGSLLDETYNVPDTARIRQVEKMIAYANSKGITVWVHGWWGREKISEEKMRRWWRYLIARLGAYNVVWVLAGEYNMNNYSGMGLQFWKNLGEMIDSQDAYERIISVHPTPPGWKGGAEAPQWSTGEVIHKEAWLDYNQSQVGHGKWRNEMIPLIVAADYARLPSKPIVVTEPWYEFVKDNPPAEDIRFGGWSAILSGAAGHTYGGGHVYRAHVPEAPASGKTWPLEMGFHTDTLDYPGAVSISYMAKFLKKIHWWKLEPHPEMVLEYPDKYCAAVPGEQYVVYLRWGGAIKVDLRPSSDKDIFEYTWIDLTEGKQRGAGTVSGGEIRYFHTPEDYPGYPHYKDWVLHIRKALAPKGS